MGTSFNVLLSFTRASHLFNDFPEWSLIVAFLGCMLHLLAREQHDSSSLSGRDSRVDVLVPWPKLMMLCEVSVLAHLFAFTPDHRGDGAGHETGREAAKQSHLPVHRHNVPRWKTKPTSVRCFRHSKAGRPSWSSVTHRRRRSRAGTGLFVRTRWCPQWAAEVHGPPGGSSHRIRTDLLHHGKTKSEPDYIHVKDVNIRYKTP